MAINSNCVLGDKNPVRSQCSSKTSNLSSCRLIKINFAGKDSCSSSRAHGPNNLNNKDLKSPYFANDKVQLLSRVTAKKFSNRKPTEFISSFPLAASVYKANSDEFKIRKRGNNKVKKSVLTLPNEPVPMPKTYTVSDLNDSEYFNAANDGRSNKPKKRRSVKRNKKSRVKEHTTAFRDRDARYCSQLNIDLDCSSSEIVNITGDGERISKLSYKSNQVKAGTYPHDVWAVLRNINNFQFRPSPPASQQSVVPLRKRRPIIRKTNNSNDTHFIETCRTEEFAYISSFEVDSKSHESCSPSSSFDRVTVIDKQSDQDEIMQQFSRNIFGSNLNFGEKIKSNINTHMRGKNKPRLKNCNKKVVQAKKKTQNNQVLESNMPNPIPCLREKVLAQNSNAPHFPELTSKTSNLIKPVENCSDDISIQEKDSICNAQINNNRKGDQSGDTNEFRNIKSLTKKLKVNVLKPIDDAEKQLNGITKVILSKGKELVSPRLSEAQRKPRLALTLPNTNVPKLSRFEIRRRLANQKFPIVILGKDQVTNRGLYVPNVDPPQFEGLDKHIWPFMLEWSKENQIKHVEDIQTNEINTYKHSKSKNKANNSDGVTMNIKDLCNQNIITKKGECKRKKNSTSPTTGNQIQLPEAVQKSKPLFHLKNKMFNFLQKSPTTLSNNRRVEPVLKDKQVGTSETVKNYNNLNNKSSLISVHLKEVTEPIENKIVQKSYSPLRHPWAKGKWASDFIENIIKKIRTGVYYGAERKENKHRIRDSDVSTQTETYASKNAYCQNSVDFDSNSTEYKDDPLKDIPGFDKTFTTLEIETISTNKIAVKHCVTNVVVHFDIQVLSEEKYLTHTKKSMSCIPIDVTNKEEKVFKCSTSIINAILPAELCSIIPTMMRNILDAENKLYLQSATVENVQSHSTAISEFSTPQCPHLIMNSLLPRCSISDKIRPFLNGVFRNSLANYKSIRRDFMPTIDSRNNVVTLLPTFNMQIPCHYNQPSVILHVSLNTLHTTIERPNQGTSTRDNYYMALLPYEPKKFSVVPYNGLFNITEFVKQMIDKLYDSDLNNIKMMINNFTCYNGNNIVSRPLFFSQSKNILSISLNGKNKVGVISLFNACKKSNTYNNEKADRISNITETYTEEKKEILRILSDESKTQRKKGQPIKMLRKKSYVRFYRKCNSMSSISSYKSTLLNKITNLEEFCQVLGSNLFSNVLDGSLEKKMLNAIEEMKNWITDISPKQALLILLLINKKDTPNLIRFRPVLLQGIAVNRITKSDELDTEIEVIERENFHKLSQYDGISYLPASSKNQDSLLEELYWIAKTTASDYQKTFDESSEKLLKSLLEKRKKLNPSYLRVMARYVGLGLLAPPKL